MYITCKKDTPENNYNYNCPKISNDNWDELNDPCYDCPFRCFIEIPDKED